jgi:hypothetical protein
VERWRLFFARQISETVAMTSSAEPPGKPWYKRFLRFDRKRWWAFGLILGLIYFLALFGVWLTIFIPFLGTPLFITRLMIWYIPGILFSWTGLFAFHEFGASPTGWLGHLVMFGFYACVAAIASWPFGLTRKRR